MKPNPASRIAVTMGDPSGIGPEIIIKSFIGGSVKRESASTIILGDANLLAHEARRNKIRITINSISRPSERLLTGSLNVLNLSDLGGSTRYGKPSPEAAEASLTYIDHALRLATEGEIGGLVTGPVNKNSIFNIFHGFRGHTEYIAGKTGSAFPVMLMVSPTLKVVPLSTHVSLRNAIENLDISNIVGTLKIMNRDLERFFAIKKPRIAVAGLNPHSGEEIFGTEERDIIYPAIKSAQAIGINATGPWPPDTVYVAASYGNFDAVLGMYHDQALIPVKLGAFHKVINVTLGIPIIRTSVGHGVAYDIAGKWKASHESLDLAIKTARLMIKKSGRRKRPE